MIQLYSVVIDVIVIFYHSGERAGAFSLITSSKDEAARTLSQIKILIRPMYSNPPIHGARIVSEILGDSALKAEWFVYLTVKSA